MWASILAEARGDYSILLLKKEVWTMTTLSVWEPTRELATARQMMDRLFNEAFAPSRQGSRSGFGGTFYLPIDVWTTEDHVVVQAALPGLKPEDVEIIYQGDTIHIRGELAAPQGNVQWALQERPYGKFSRSLTLNVPIDANKVEAVFENGLLTLTMPKAEWAKPRQIQIKGQTAGAAEPQIHKN
jgi:HSP20 family protein